ncbi:DUF3631 domain-containing protein [Streptomyces sp. RFCAC02]|uniref:DUF3631 domain-containing protein n=1 Tax=Streptomyces sp. RFCAC02 TaxID=2499143 RepID=UPI00101F1467|nr:DUF3631 domain-containing protein [Streptomyces sp. RFCAC02]
MKSPIVLIWPEPGQRVVLVAETTHATPRCSCTQAGRTDSPEPMSLLDACLTAFSTAGDPAAMASADLVAGLRHLPGTAEGRWLYRDLTQQRLAHLLAPYRIHTRDTRLGNGRRLKAYHRADLAALGRR